MSEASRAWSWRHAFSSSSLPATTKHVLHTLGMFMNELGEGCYPSVADICRYSGLDKKTVLKHLATARDAGWIAVSQHGYRGQKWKRQEYAARWPERDLTASCPPQGGGTPPPPSAGSDVVESASQGGGIEGSKVVEQVHQDKTSPVTTPDTSPAEREARATEREEGQSGTLSPADIPGRADFQKRVMRFCSGRGFIAGPWKDWDTGAAPDWIAGKFAKLTPEERVEAERWRDAYLLDMADRKKDPVMVGNFLAGKMWEALDPAILERAEKRKQAQLGSEEQAKPDGWAPMLGPVGMARLFALLIAGQQEGDPQPGALWLEAHLRRDWPAVHQWKQLHQSKGGIVFGERWHALKDAMEPVPRDSDALSDWRAAFAERGWPWIAVFDRLDVVFCPKGGPAGLDEFEAAVKRLNEGCGNDGGQREAAE